MTSAGMTGVVPPPWRAAILAAAVRSRWPVNWQTGQASTRPAGLGIRDRQAGQVEEVPRSSTSWRLIAAASYSTVAAESAVGSMGADGAVTERETQT